MEYSTASRTGGEYGVSQPVGPSRPTLSIRRRQFDTTAVLAVVDLPPSPPPLSGMRRAQLTGLYMRLLERALDRCREGGPKAYGFARLDRLVSRVRLRLWGSPRA